LRAWRNRTPRRPPTDRERLLLETCWSAGVGLSGFDLIRASVFQVRHGLLAFESGDPRHLARALSVEAFLLTMEGGPRKRR
ncbi:hypothetical protein Q8G41_28860, partial [Klebsiella pneumoniae]|uniref:hypothetical protein n=1 Tax=Klebsiella pneumoniae TaxID=573 RepID=UPI0030134FB3